MTRNVSNYAENVLKRINILANPYFQRLESGEMTLELFRQTQTQFYFAVKFFSRPMSALIDRMPAPKKMLKSFHKIVEARRLLRFDGDL